MARAKVTFMVASFAAPMMKPGRVTVHDVLFFWDQEARRSSWGK